MSRSLLFGSLSIWICCRHPLVLAAAGDYTVRNFVGVIEERHVVSLVSTITGHGVVDKKNEPSTSTKKTPSVKEITHSSNKPKPKVGNIIAKTRRTFTLLGARSY